MKIIAIEGLDKSGKATQTRLLAERLQYDGYTVVQSEFHRYDTPTGELVMDWLTKKWDVDQRTIELIMTADKQAQQTWFQKLEDHGTDYLILDRYTLSQQVYASANGISYGWTRTLQEYMRQPDLQIIIDIPAETSMTRKGKHNDGKNDRYESDKEMLERVRNYLLIEAEYHHYYVVNGEQHIEDIAQEIYKVTYNER